MKTIIAQEATEEEIKERLKCIYFSNGGKGGLLKKETKINFAKVLNIINKNFTEEEKNKAQNKTIRFCFFEDCEKCESIFESFKERQQGSSESSGCPSLLIGKIKQIVPTVIARACISSQEFTTDKICEEIIKVIGNKGKFYKENGNISYTTTISLILKNCLKNAFEDEILKEELYKLFENLTGTKI